MAAITTVSSKRQMSNSHNRSSDLVRPCDGLSFFTSDVVAREIDTSRGGYGPGNGRRPLVGFVKPEPGESLQLMNAF